MSPRFTPGPLDVRIGGTLTGVSADIIQKCVDPDTGEEWDRHLGSTETAYVRKTEAYKIGRWEDYGEAPEQYDLTDDGEEHLANAHLWAAAPDLYEALEGLIGFAESAEAKALVGDEGCLWPMEFARAALAKARGEA